MSGFIRINVVFILLLFVFHSISLAQAPQNGRPEFKFHSIQVELNNNQVTSIYQDHFGFIWIGTFGGLHKFDGIGFEIYTNSADPNSLSENRIECLLEDSKGNLWVGTYDGLCRYDVAKNNFVRYETGDESDQTTNRIRAIVEDPSGRIWVGSQITGLFLYDESHDKFSPYWEEDAQNLLGSNKITSIAIEENGSIWIGTQDAGIGKLNPISKEVILYQHDENEPSSLNANYIGELVVDMDNTLWVGTNYEGVDKLVIVNDTIRFIHYQHNPKFPNQLSNNDIRSMLVDSQNRVWTCNENGGLNIYSRENDTFYSYLPNPSDPYSISSNSIWCLYEDRQNRIWVGSAIEGVEIIDKYKFKFDYYTKSFGFTNSLNNNLVRKFYEDTNGNIFIATDGGGINILNRKTGRFQYLMHDADNPNSINSNAVLSFCKQDNSRLWVGTWQGGINIMDLTTNKFVDHPYKTKNLYSVFSIIKDTEGFMWVGSYEGGLHKINPKTNEIITYSNIPNDTSSISNNIIPVVIQDSNQNIWAGTEDNGLNLLLKENMDTGKFIRFSPDPSDSMSLPSKYISDIFEDSEKKIWVATSKGLALYLPEHKKFKTYNQADGFSSNIIRAINEDNHGNLWISTSKGLSKMNPSKGVIRNYDEGDGLQPGEFSRYSTLKLSTGELLFGGINGFNIFHPDSIQDNPNLPQVYITGLKLFNKPITTQSDSTILPKQISQLDELTLSYEYSVITFDFIALNYTTPDKNKYAFMLEGLESEWNFVENQRSATYTNLDPGNYVFHIIASNNDGLWNMEGKSLKVKILPPYWKTAWFRILILLILGTIIYSIFYLRTQNLKKLNLELEHNVSERTEQLNAMVFELKEKQDEIETNNEELTATMEELYQQKVHIEKMNEELSQTHKSLENMNSELDQRVKDRTSELVKANQELDRFVYSASHDLSAPLKSIEGLIKITKIENKDKMLLEHLSHMEKSVSKFETVIKSLTQFSRNIGHTVTNTVFTFDFLVTEILDEIRYDKTYEHIEIIKEYKGPCRIESDFLRIKIIISNILSNALKYSDCEKPNPFIKLNFKDENDTYVFDIEDNGIGIDTENKKKVFDMFYRATEQSTGSGLGLYIVKETINKLDGKIKVESEPKNFTRVTVIIPKTA